MKLILSKYRSRGFTALDLIIVLATLVLAALLLPALIPAKVTRRSPQFTCISNLKQIGLGFRLWAGDHGDKFPMSVSNADGGTSDFVGIDQVFHHLLAASNEMNYPRIFACPGDKRRKVATQFATFSNSNLSYFVGLDASELDSRMILSGDRNISTNGRLLSGILTFNTNVPINWTKDIHVRCGNIGLADGSAKHLTNAALMNAIDLTANRSTRLAIP
jgi:hypothetical protein